MNNISQNKLYYKKIRIFLGNCNSNNDNQLRLNLYQLKMIFSSIWNLGIKQEGRFWYWKLFFWSIFNKPKLFINTMVLLAIGIYFSVIE